MRIVADGRSDNIKPYDANRLADHTVRSAIGQQECWAIAKTTARCALHMCALKIFESPWVRPWLLFPKFLMGVCSYRSLNVRRKFEVRSFTRSWGIRGYPTNLGSPLIRPRSLFWKIFNSLLFGWTPWMYRPNLKSVYSFTLSWDNSDWIFGWGSESQSQERGGRRVSGMVAFERTLVNSYRPSILG